MRLRQDQEPLKSALETGTSLEHESEERLEVNGSKDSLPEGGQVLGITHGRTETPRPSDVDVVAFARTCTHLDREEQQDT